MWRAFLGLLFTLAGVLSSAPATAADSEQIRVAELVRTLSSRTKTSEDRDRAAEQLQEHDAALVLPAVLAELEQLESQGESLGLGYLGPDEKLSDGQQALRALYRVWYHFDADNLKHGKSHGKTLVAMLKQAKAPSSRALIIDSLGHHYVPEAEAPLAAIMRDDKNPEQFSCAKILLAAQGEKYGPILIDRVADKKRTPSSRHDYLQAFCGPSYKALKEEDKQRLVRAGFALLAENREYFTAAYLGDFVGVKFFPNTDDPRYRDGSNLNKAFYDDTVKNALAWWAVRRKNYE